VPIRTFVHLLAQSFAYPRTCTRKHSRIRTRAHFRAFAHIKTCAHPNMRTHAHKHMHTHTQTCAHCRAQAGACTDACWISRAHSRTEHAQVCPCLCMRMRLSMFLCMRLCLFMCLCMCGNITINIVRLIRAHAARMHVHDMMPVSCVLLRRSIDITSTYQRMHHTSRAPAPCPAQPRRSAA
jgi:hypothetical protein